MSLNDKARAALRRELAKAFPERPENDPGHAKLAAALSDTAHTPGQWRAAATHGEWTKEPFLVWDDSIDAAICHVFNRSEAGRDNHAQQAANARLIAAAPELLEALKALRDLRNQWRNDDRFTSIDYMDAIDAMPWEAAIAKAEGGAK